MTPRVAKPNLYELRNRRAKCDALVQEINRMAAELRVSPGLMLNAVAVWGDREWTQLALNIGKTKPSSETVTAVLATLSRAVLVQKLAEVRP